jgi:hypothetical protein
MTNGSLDDVIIAEVSTNLSSFGWGFNDHQLLQLFGQMN